MRTFLANLPRPGGRFARSLSRLAGQLLVAAIVVLTVVPPKLRPTTAAPHDFEHAAIFVLAALCLGIGYRGRALLLSAGAVAFCAAIEVVQLFIPGRHARLEDFVTDLAAALVGLWLPPACGYMVRISNRDGRQKPGQDR